MAAMTTTQAAMQDLIKVHCYGCGAHNQRGLQIKSFWAGDEVVCAWRPSAEHIGHPGVLYGGLIASVVDCHSIWTAAANAYRRAGREMDGTLEFQYVTAALRIDYRKPVPIEQAVELRARETEFSARKSVVRCTASSRGVVCAEAEVVAVRVAVAPPAAGTIPPAHASS